MTTNKLTEKWKKGELPKGYYYAEDDGEELIIHIQGKNGSVMGDDFDLKATDWIKPITPVPSYEEWQQMKAFCEEFNALNVAEENQKLKEEIKMLKEVIYDLGGFECPKCGKYHNRHFICWNCGYDYTAPEV